MTTKAYHVNYLLMISRLPDHFYAMIHGLTGRDAMYQNPGVALRSFVVSQCLRNEIVTMTGENLNLIKECEEFSTSLKTILKIMELLQENADTTLNRISVLPEDMYRKFHKANESLINRITDLRHELKQFENDISTSTAEHIDMSQVGAPTIKQYMFELNEICNLLLEEIPDAPKTWA